MDCQSPSSFSTNTRKSLENKLAQYLAHLAPGSGNALSRLASGHWENKELPLEKINSPSQACIPFKQGPSIKTGHWPSCAIFLPAFDTQALWPEHSVTSPQLCNPSVTY